MIQTRLQVPRIQTHFWDQQSLLDQVDSAIKCPSPTADSVQISRITETEVENGALYCGFRRMSQPRTPCSPKPVDNQFPPRKISRGIRGILRRRNDPPRTARPKRTVSFDTNQFHRPEEHYRSDSEFDRSSSCYTPGIYADLSGNGYEDTSKCCSTDLFDAQADTYLPASHEALENAMRLQIKITEPQDSIPLPESWLSERLQSSADSAKSTKISMKKSRSGRSKKSERGVNSSCNTQSTLSLQLPSRGTTSRAVSAR